MLYKLALAALAALVSLITHAPVTLHRIAAAAVWFIFIDTLTGVVCARISGEMSSSAFRKKLNSKLVCYAGTLGLTAGIAATSGEWGWLIFGWYAVMASEGISIAENLSGIMKTGGPALAPLAAVLAKITSFLSTSTLANAPGAAAAPKEGSDADGSGTTSAS